jgi:ornithine--oxo-acid transaminase
MDAKELIDLTERYSAHNYAPLEIVARSAEGVWITDVEGHRYLDMVSAYSAINFGHCNPRLIRAARAQLDTLTLTSRAIFSEPMALLSKELATLCRKDKVLLMNSGAEAVETSLKCARKWGQEVKGITEDAAEIVCFSGNFHGRTTTIVGFSTSDESRVGFGPFTPGFVIVPFGDANAAAAAINRNTAAILVEPIQGEGGIIIPPVGFLSELRRVCTEHNVLLIADEIQTGLCRAGDVFACDHEGVEPDIFILGKSLGGGIVPISAIAANDSVMSVFTPGVHGSTFGGNPFACAIAREVIALILEEKPHERAKALGVPFEHRLRTIQSPALTQIRARGLMIGLDIAPEFGVAKDFCKKLKYEGLITKDTRQQTIRLAPALTITQAELDWAFERIERVFRSVG